MTAPLPIPAPSRTELCSGRFGAMLDALSDFAIQLAVTLADAAMLLLAPPHAIPTPQGSTKHVKDPTAAFLRAGRALLWLSALSNVFTGLYILPRRRLPAAAKPDSAPTPLAASPPNSRRGAPAARPLGEDRWMRTVFATRPIGDIVARICRDLGLTSAAELWPADFLTITETLPEWAARTLPPQRAACRTPSLRNPSLRHPSLRASREALAHLRRSNHGPSPGPSPIGRHPNTLAIQPVRSG